MTTDITVKTRIRVNGQEYASVDDMPDDVRQLYQRALATIAGGKHSGLLDISGQGASTNAHAVSGLSDSQEHTSVDQVHLHVAGVSGDPQALSNPRIVFNGQQYIGVEQMPVAVRRLYDGVIATLDDERNDTPGSAAAGVPEVGQAQWPAGEGARSMPASWIAAGAVRPEATRAWLLIVGAVLAIVLVAWFELGW